MGKKKKVFSGNPTTLIRFGLHLSIVFELISKLKKIDKNNTRNAHIPFTQMCAQSHLSLSI